MSEFGAETGVKFALALRRSARELNSECITGASGGFRGEATDNPTVHDALFPGICTTQQVRFQRMANVEEIHAFGFGKSSSTAS